MGTKAGAFLVALALSLGVAALAGADDWEDANASYKLDDYATALKLLGRLAARGDARAQNLLGEMYLDGKGVTKSDAEALKWFGKAEKQGLAGAQANLGLMYSQGYGVPKDPVEGVKWYRKAAAQGEPSSQYNLGRAYKLGEGVAQDPVEAYRWYDLAAANTASTDMNRTWAAQVRDEVAAKMTPEQLAQVRKPAQ